MVKNKLIILITGLFILMSVAIASAAINCGDFCLESQESECTGSGYYTPNEGTSCDVGSSSDGTEDSGKCVVHCLKGMSRTSDGCGCSTTNTLPVTPPPYTIAATPAAHNGCKIEGEVVRSGLSDECYECKEFFEKESSENKRKFIKIDIKDKRCEGKCVDHDLDEDPNSDAEKFIPSFAKRLYGDEMEEDSCDSFFPNMIDEAICDERDRPTTNRLPCPEGTRCKLSAEGRAYCGGIICGELCTQSSECEGWYDNPATHLCDEITKKCRLINCDSNQGLRLDSTGCNCISICDDENPCTVDKGSTPSECDNREFIADHTKVKDANGVEGTCMFGKHIKPNTMKMGEPCTENSQCFNDGSYSQVFCSFSSSTARQGKCYFRCSGSNNMIDEDKKMCVSICNDNNPCTDDIIASLSDLAGNMHQHCDHFSVVGRSCVSTNPIAGFNTGACDSYGKCIILGPNGDAPTFISHIIANEPHIQNLISCAENKLTTYSAEPCLNEIILTDCDVAGRYNLYDRNIQICDNPNSIYDSSDYYASAYATLEHELLHAIQICGSINPRLDAGSDPVVNLDPLKGECLQRYSHELASYLCEGRCNDKEHCLQTAVASVYGFTPPHQLNPNYNPCFAGPNAIMSMDEFEKFGPARTWYDEWWALNVEDSNNYICDKLMDHCQFDFDFFDNIGPNFAYA